MSTVLEQFYSKKPKWDVRCNDDFLTTNSQHPLTVERLEAAAERISHRLAVNGDYIRTFNAFYTENPQWANCDANTDHLVELHRGDPISLESLREVSKSSQCHTLAANPEYIDQQREANRRQQMIQEITEGKTQYKYYDGRHGKFIYYDSSHLDSETDERVAEIHQLVTSQRAAINQSPAERKAVSKQQAQQQKGAYVLVNPITGVEYTRKELISVINGDKSGVRRLLVGPDNRAIPEAKAAIERILRSKE